MGSDTLLGVIFREFEGKCGTYRMKGRLPAGRCTLAPQRGRSAVIQIVKRRIIFREVRIRHGRTDRLRLAGMRREKKAV